MIRFLPILLLFGCASAPVVTPVVPESRRAENWEMPEHPRDAKLPKGIQGGEWVLPLEAGSCTEATQPCPKKAGILISEAKAARVRLYKIRYDELRKTYIASRMDFTADRIRYEEKLRLSLREIEDLQPGWWDENKGTVAFASGIIVGGVIAVVIAHAMADAVPNTVTVEGM